MDGLFCVTWLRSTCGSKVHRVPFISPLFLLLCQQRLVSQLLSFLNTSVDKGERTDERLAAYPCPDPLPPSSVQQGGARRIVAVFGSGPCGWLPGSSEELLCTTFGSSGQMPPLVFSEIKFPRADAAAPLLKNNLICSLNNKQTALVSRFTGVIFLVYILYKRTHQFLQAT